MAASRSVIKLVKEVLTVNGLPTVVSKILPRNNIHKHVIVLIPGNPGLVEFYDDFITALFDSLQRQYPVYAMAHAGMYFKSLMYYEVEACICCINVLGQISFTNIYSDVFY